MRAARLSLAYASIVGLFAVGCSAATGPGAEDAVTFEQAKSNVVRDTAPDATPAEMATLAEGNAELTMRLHQKLAKPGENAFFSPLSIVSALSMTYAGARGVTATEMESALSFKLPAARHHVAMNALDLALASRSEGAASERKPFVLRAVNTTFGQKGYPFEQPFLDTIAKNYGAGVQLADFETQADQERQKINLWVEQKTEQKIKDLLAPSAIDQSTRLVLVNAVYFNADWAAPFEKSATADAPFTTMAGAKIQVPTMNAVAQLKYTDTEAAQVVELPYQGNKVSMVVVVPRQDIAKFETGFDGKALLSAMQGLTETKSIKLSLPKFKIEGDSVSLKQPLVDLGMKSAFSDADFSGMTSKGSLVVDDVYHKAFVRVDEEGTEAAAATAVVMRESAAPIGEIEVRADRPFLFFIRDIPTNTVLFAGRIAAPK